jgi:pimeloyl-ACP methyl ester carboxylesterase
MDGELPRGESRTSDLGGPVHWVEYGRPDNDGAPPLVLVHGLGGSHLNWDLIAPHLTPHARVVALDLPGFGRSEPGERRATVPANVEVLDRFLAAHVDRPAVLVGNSMGGMISVLEAARSPERVAGLALLDPAVPGPRRRLDPLVASVFAIYALPGVGERFLWLRRHRQTPLQRALSLLRLCGIDPDSLPPEVVDRSVELIEQRADAEAMDTAFLTAARSLLRVLADPRAYRRAMAALHQPVLLVHGDRDRLVPVDAARALARRHPEWRYVELPGIGHVPQLQDAPRVAAELLGWLAHSGLGDSDSRSASSPL